MLVEDEEIMEYLFNFDKLCYLKGTRPEGCILCLVASGSEEVERLVVHETGSFVASLNLYPYNPGHLILFPKRHVVDIRALSAAERSELDALTDLCLAVLDATMTPSAYNIGYNMGLSAGASIEHLHLHIIPRYPREIGIAELIAGSRVLVQDPRQTKLLLEAAFARVELHRDDPFGSPA
jgi:ATP adenylyltransferase